MKKSRITKDELAQGLAGLQVGQGLEAKFYNTGGVVVVTFECMADADGKPETTFRMGRKSQLRRSFADVDDVWNILTVDNGLEPPKELVPIAVPEKIRTKPTVQTGFVEMRGVLTYEQADKIATMMLYAAQYDGAFVDWPGLHIEKNDEENVQAIVSAIVRVCRSAGVELDEEKLSGLTKFSQYDFSTNIGEDAVRVLQSKYSDAPVYYDIGAGKPTGFSRGMKATTPSVVPFLSGLRYSGGRSLPRYVRCFRRNMMATIGISFFAATGIPDAGYRMCSLSIPARDCLC